MGRLAARIGTLWQRAGQAALGRLEEVFFATLCGFPRQAAAAAIGGILNRGKDTMKDLGRFILMVALAVLPAAAMAVDSAAASAAKQTIADYYAAWAAHDIARYRSLCAPDYLILDNGEMSDLDQDIVYLRVHPEAWRGRTDHFDFRKVIVRSDEAYVVYFLNSEIRNGQAVEHRRYLERADLRQDDSCWQVFRLHSSM